MKFRPHLAPLFAPLFSLLLLCVSGQAQADERGDRAFLATRDALKNGRLEALEQNLPATAGHPLGAYAENYRLRMLLARNDSSGIPPFLAANEGSYVAEKLRGDWLRWAGRQANWNLVLNEYPRLLAPDTELSCYQQQARWQQGEPTVLDELAPQWLTLLEPPEACLPLLAQLAQSSRLSSDAIWTRARRQIEINRDSWAARTLAYLPAGQAPDSKRFTQATKSGMAFLAKQPGNWASSRAERELAIYAIQQLASNDPAIAAEQLSKRESQLKPDERQWAWSQIALQAARRHQPETLAWYEKAGKVALSDENQQWKVRSALRALEWGLVRQTIENMPSALAARPEWVYWLGRAYKAGGRTSQADALFARISRQANFYGNLADEELGLTITPPPRAREPSPEESQAARDLPGLQRALNFFRLDLRLEGVREWNWALRGMNDRQLLAAADLARQNQIWDRAINTAEKTQNEHDYSLRFLAPYGEQVRPAARQQALDDAWVYGLMRQESRFISSARSTVGASGLMQLMPATAKWVAKKIGLSDYHHGRVNDTEINVLLGTSYMRLVMENLDNHPVLASAAYNAGPSRAKRWRAERPLEGAIYAESIPFSETRDYVKKVMSNAVYYSTLFNGKPDSLKARLGIVAPSGSQAMKDADLP